MESGSVLKEALVLVRRALKARGFSAKGTTFYRNMDDGNTVVLSLQKSVKSSPANTEVTLNFGVYSARVGGRLQDEPSSALDVMKAHWRKRLTENGREKWLHVKSTDTEEQTARVILEAIDSVLPELVHHSTDDALRDEWLSRSSPGVGNMQRLVFLAIIVNEIGPTAKLGEVVKELRGAVDGGVHEALVRGRLKRAGIRME